ncbi:MAG: GNAT family N-acetyltransferase [Actinoallomurus sp.]
MLYDLTSINQSQLSTVVGVEFIALKERSPPPPLVIPRRPHILVALVDDQSAALSIIEPDGDIGFDALTWVDPAWRHLGIATLLKRQAFQNARQGGIAGLWASDDAGSAPFYESVGIRPVPDLTK